MVGVVQIKNTPALRDSAIVHHNTPTNHFRKQADRKNNIYINSIYQQYCFPYDRLVQISGLRVRLIYEGAQTLSHFNLLSHYAS